MHYRKQLEQQAKENALLKQQVPISRISHLHHQPVTSTSTSHTMTSASSKVAYTNSLPPASVHSGLPHPTPPSLIIPASSNMHPGGLTNPSHSPESQDGTSQSLSLQSSFTNVSPMSSVLSERMEESSREVRVKTTSSRPPANLEGQRRSPADKSNE